MHIKIACFFLCALSAFAAIPAYAADDSMQFSDQPMHRDFSHPAWFKQSFLNLPQDLDDVRKAGKSGLIVYFGQANCAYCEQLLKINFGRQTDIVAYIRKYFEVVEVDIWGSLEVVTPAGDELTEKSYADREKTTFTPSLIFYNPWGKEVFRLSGYYPPYMFRAALDFVVGEYYHEQTFRAYVERAAPMTFEEGELNHSKLFSEPPYLLSRHDNPADRPLVVFFEQPDCHACDILHGEALYENELYLDLSKMEAVQLNMWRDTPVITPDGERTTARAWADKLELFYTPTLIFFDEQGREIIRVDSTVQQYRLSKVVKYVLGKGYLEYPHFLRWYSDWRRRQEAGSLQAN